MTDSSRRDAAGDAVQRKGLPMTLYVALAVLAVILLVLWMRIDDWGRDWNTNSAQLQASSPDPQLRPMTRDSDPAQVADDLTAAMERNARWALVSREADKDGMIRLHLTHSTAILKFVDDVHVTLTPVDSKTRVDATSQSRIGKGDLGQNPRNLKALLEILRESSNAEAEASTTP